MARGNTEHECTSCGGPLAIPAEGDRYSTCAFCGTVVELDLPPDDEEPAAPSIRITVNEPIGTSGGRRGAIVGMAVVVAAGAAIFAGVDTSTPPSAVFPDVTDDIREAIDGLNTGGDATGLYGISAARVVIAEDDTTPDVLAAGPAPDVDALLALLDAESDGGVRWQTSLPATDVYMAVLADSDRFHLGIDDRLVTLDRSDGHEVWSVELSDVVHHHICHDCLQRLDDLVVVLTSDGVITGYEATDGTTRWERRLAETPRQLLDVGGRPAVYDVVDDVRELHVLDPAEGTTVQRLPISCADPTFGGRDQVGPYDWLIPLDGGSFLHVSDDPISPCAQRWDAGADGPAWEVGVELPFAPQIDPEHVLVAEGRLHLVGRDRAVTLDLATGGTVASVTSEDHDLVPIWADADTLVVGAESTRGSRTWELQGIDLATVSVSWSHPVDAMEFGSTGWATPVRDNGRWSTFPTTDGITLWQGLPDQLARFTTLDMASGDVTADVSVPVSGEFSPTVEVLHWRGNSAWLRVDTAVLVVDVASGDVTSQLP